MKRWPILGVGLVATLGVLGVVHGQGAPSSSAGSPSASQSASSRPPPTPDMWTDPLELASAEIPSTRSEPPKRDEWKAGVKVKVAARNDRARSCDVRLLREYVRVSCPQPMGGARQYVGSTKDVEVFVRPKSYPHLFQEPHGGEVVFPLRRGEAYLFQFFELSEGYDGFGLSASMVVDVSWSGGRKAPTVVIR